jgi:hypothetical protein
MKISLDGNSATDSLVDEPTHVGQDTSPMLTRHTCHKHTSHAHLFYMNEMIKNDYDINLHYCNMANSDFFPSKYGDFGHYLPPKKTFYESHNTSFCCHNAKICQEKKH